jgi:hypothetical protein
VPVGRRRTRYPAQRPGLLYSAPCPATGGSPVARSARAHLYLDVPYSCCVHLATTQTLAWPGSVTLVASTSLREDASATITSAQTTPSRRVLVVIECVFGVPEIAMPKNTTSLACRPLHRCASHAYFPSRHRFCADGPTWVFSSILVRNYKNKLRKFASIAMSCTNGFESTFALGVGRCK